MPTDVQVPPTPTFDEHLVERLRADAARRRRRRSGLVAAPGALLALAAGAVVWAPWSSGDPDVRIDLGGGQPTEPAPRPVALPPDFPLARSQRLPASMLPEPGSLRRRVASPTEGVSVWTGTAPNGQATLYFGNRDWASASHQAGCGDVTRAPAALCIETPPSRPVTVIGSVGRNVRGVRIAYLDRAPIDAILGDGYFIAHGPAHARPVSIIATDAESREIGRTAIGRLAEPGLPRPTLPVVPDVGGLPGGLARERLEQAGFPTEDRRGGYVFDQQPRGGSAVPAGTPVRLRVTKSMPDGFVRPRFTSIDTRGSERPPPPLPMPNGRRLESWVEAWSAGASRVVIGRTIADHVCIYVASPPYRGRCGPRALVTWQGLALRFPRARRDWVAVVVPDSVTAIRFGSGRPVPVTGNVGVAPIPAGERRVKLLGLPGLKIPGRPTPPDDRIIAIR